MFSRLLKNSDYLRLPSSLIFRRRPHLETTSSTKPALQLAASGSKSDEVDFMPVGERTRVGAAVRPCVLIGDDSVGMRSYLRTVFTAVGYE
jgi:hypothetical protein